ncbi:hypothetical protein HYQ46_013151 [Verticillium longisporum]|nr:hypothetical protein HYQ46_013151 [Verticillium longisporum]
MHRWTRARGRIDLNGRTLDPAQRPLAFELAASSLTIMSPRGGMTRSSTWKTVLPAPSDDSRKVKDRMEAYRSIPVVYGTSLVRS